MTKRLAWLFDVDGTLLTTEGAAREAFAWAVGEHLGVEDDLRDVAFAGRTEPLILADILNKHRHRFENGEEAVFWNSVFSRMREIFQVGRGRLMPGVAELLDAVGGEPTWVMGLLTGNMTQMAQIKLSRFGINQRFAFGGFGEQAADRNALARKVVSEVAATYGIPASRCIVVGDTEHDIGCARAAGARAVAVATGIRSRSELEPLGPDQMLDDLRHPEALLRWAHAIASTR